MANNEDYIKLMATELASRSTASVVAESTLLILIMLAALLGNLLILIIMWKSPTLRTVTNYYIVTLAISDIFCASIVMPFSVSILVNGKWVFSNLTCSVFAFVSWFQVLGSLQITALVAVNRYFCVVRPHAYRKWFTKKKALLMITQVWLVSLCTLIILLSTGFANVYFSPEKFTCFLSFGSSLIEQFFQVFSSLIFVFLPVSIMSMSYAKVIKVIKQHKLDVFASNRNQEISASGPNIEEIKVTKSLLALVLGFILCWVPVSVIQTVHAFSPGTLPRYAHVMFSFFAYLSSAINPYVYGILNRAVRVEILRLLGFTRRRVSGEQHSSTRTVTISVNTAWAAQ